MAHPMYSLVRSQSPRWAHDVHDNYADGGVVIGHRRAQQRDPHGRFARAFINAASWVSGKVAKPMPPVEEHEIDHLGIRG